jgi:hypothetical protein
MYGSLLLEVCIVIVLMGILLGAQVEILVQAATVQGRGETLGQAVMAAKGKLEEYRANTTYSVGTYPWQPGGFDRLGTGSVTIAAMSTRLFRITLSIRDLAGNEVYATQSVLRSR